MFTTAGLRTNGRFGLILAAVFGATVASGEFRHRTVTDTYLDEPNSFRVLGAKTIAAAAVGFCSYTTSVNLKGTETLDSASRDQFVLLDEGRPGRRFFARAGCWNQ